MNLCTLAINNALGASAYLKRGQGFDVYGFYDFVSFLFIHVSAGIPCPNMAPIFYKRK